MIILYKYDLFKLRKAYITDILQKYILVLICELRICKKMTKFHLLHKKDAFAY